MNGSSRTFWPLVAAVGLGVSFVGYCVYFDRKRRSAPDFPEKLKAKRKKQQQRGGGGGNSSSHSDLDTSNPEDMRRYFLEQIQQGEDCLSRGDLDNGVDHLAKAVAVCSQPQNLMALFQQTLPPELFQEIIMRLPRIAQSVHGSASSSALGSAILTEPDLE
ncbi:unnamed protein product [Adineta steineri]|uniref:Mitochondrial import receptor subunit TOM20-like protein n=1 Tax=Adineta steineri TaxID=433720 RepID=A0A813XPF1_9BILA|nr:unnamed protein product [Adineta steineri]CAF0871053.1 unnamed protein product [Adineta steineri]CAF3639810.1 unnamed protein product [Adineta steineri]CAF3789715.1 unnamed protein product [Adineta steineri]